jgi:hypothetical protein
VEYPFWVKAGKAQSEQMISAVFPYFSRAESRAPQGDLCEAAEAGRP